MCICICTYVSVCVCECVYIDVVSWFPGFDLNTKRDELPYFLAPTEVSYMNSRCPFLISPTLQLAPPHSRTRRPQRHGALLRRTRDPIAPGCHGWGSNGLRKKT